MAIIHKTVKIPIYCCTLNLLYDKEKEVDEILNELNLNNEDDYSENCEALTFIHNEQYWIVFNKNITPGIIAHESKHLVNFIYLQIDANLSLNEDEFECYLLGYIVDLIHKFVKENKIKLKESTFV